MKIADVFMLSDVDINGQGFLTATATIARGGIQNYRAFELGLDGDPLRIVRVHRPDDEVFKDASMKTFENKPVTDGHPFTEDGLVNAKNASTLTLGMTGDKVERDGNLLRTKITLIDAGAVNDVQRGRRQLSAGYQVDFELSSGTTTDGQEFDAIQKNIRGNHVALVDAGRCGSECRIGDSACPGGASCSCGGQIVSDTPKLQSVTVDGVSIETTDQGAQVIAKLQGQLAASQKALTDANTAHETAIAAKDTELGTKDGEIKKLTDEAIKPGDIDKMVNDRAVVVAKARSVVADIDIADKSNAEIMRLAVDKDGTLKDKPDAYIEALFDTVTKDVDPLRTVITDQQTSAGSNAAVDAAYDAHVARLGNAWKGGANNQKGAS